MMMMRPVGSAGLEVGDYREDPAAATLEIIGAGGRRRSRAYELRGTLATVLPLFGVDAAGVRLIGWADGDCVKMRGLGCCCWMGMRQSSPGQRPRLWGRVSQRAKAVVLVDVVALVAQDLATPPTWSDPGGPALQLHLARRGNYRRRGNDLRDNATGTSDGYSPVSAETPDGKCS